MNQTDIIVYGEDGGPGDARLCFKGESAADVCFQRSRYEAVRLDSQTGPREILVGLVAVAARSVCRQANGVDQAWTIVGCQSNSKLVVFIIVLGTHTEQVVIDAVRTRGMYRFPQIPGEYQLIRIPLVVDPAHQLMTVGQAGTAVIDSAARIRGSR